MVREITIISFVLKLLLSNVCFASNGVLSEAELKKYKEEAQSAANKIANTTIKGMFEHDLDSSHNANLKSTLSHYKGEKVEGAGLDIKRAEDKGTVQRNLGKTGENTKCTEKECDLGKLFSSSAINDRDVKLEEAGFKKDAEGNVIDNKGYIDKAKKKSQKAVKNFDFIKGEYKNCTPPDSYTVSRIKESCDQYYDVAHNNCPIYQVVEIDPRYTYECHKKREVREKICKEEVNTRCDKVMDCGFNAGGIVEGSVDTGIDWNYSYPYLRLGSRTGDWHFSCGSDRCCEKKSSSARLKIKDLKSVKKFNLHKISYDDHAMVKINGVTVHNTLGGSYLRIENHYWGSDREGDNDRKISSGARSGPCWRLYPNNGQNYYDNVNKDVKSYLREGVNEIEIQLVYAQLGQVNVVFEAEQYCCNSWNDKSEVKCQYVK